MIFIKAENWKDIKQELIPLWEIHYNEVREDNGKLELSPNIELLDALNNTNSLHIIIAREEEKIIGYHGSFLQNLPHHKETIGAITDLYWIEKSHRGGSLALRIFKEFERTCREIGVSVIYSTTKLQFDQGRLFEHLGYQPIERLYSKWIGE